MNGKDMSNENRHSKRKEKAIYSTESRKADWMLLLNFIYYWYKCAVILCGRIGDGGGCGDGGDSGGYVCLSNARAQRLRLQSQPVISAD